MYGLQSQETKEASTSDPNGKCTIPMTTTPFPVTYSEAGSTTSCVCNALLQSVQVEEPSILYTISCILSR